MAVSAAALFMQWVGLAATTWALYSGARGAWDAYQRHAQLQAENAWLYQHCMANEQLKAHTNACDQVFHLYAKSPWEAALLPPIEQAYAAATSAYEGVQQFVGQHQHAFLVLWGLLFLFLPRLFIVPHTQERARLLQKVISRHPLTPGMRQRSRCVV